MQKELVIGAGFTWLNVLNEESQVVDLGAHIGIFSKFVLEHFDSWVEAYDPITDLKIDHPKFTFHKKAVWHTSPVQCNDTLEVGNSLLREDEHCISVEAKPLDEILKDLGEVDLLKINVEGAEIALLSISQELGRAKQIVVEHHLRVADRFNTPIDQETIDATRQRLVLGFGFTELPLEQRYPKFLYYQEDLCL